MLGFPCENWWFDWTVWKWLRCVAPESGDIDPQMAIFMGKKWKHANMNPDFQTLRHSQPAQIGICYSSSHPANWINRFAAMLCKSYSTWIGPCVGWIITCNSMWGVVQHQVDGLFLEIWKLWSVRVWIMSNFSNLKCHHNRNPEMFYIY